MPDRYNADDLRRLIDSLADRIAETFADQSINLVGIRTRGETIAARLEKILRARGFKSIGRGALDITLYRDDLSELGPRPIVRPTELAIDINSAPLILVDDVIFTGRTVRAALNELADFGRPKVIRLAVLVDRGGRELPVQPDFCALVLGELPRDRRVQVKLIEVDGQDEIIVAPI